jgi:CBS domain-containing protein
MLVKEILRIKGHTLFTTPPERSVLEAVEVMAENDIGSLVVMDHGRLAGILTFAEVLRALAERRGAHGEAAVADIFARDPLTAAPGLDVMDLRRTMLLGVVSFHDVAKAVLEEQSFENRMLKSYIKDWPDEASA